MTLLVKNDIGMTWLEMCCHTRDNTGPILFITLNQACLVIADKLPELLNRLTIEQIFQLLHFSLANGKGLQREDQFRQGCC